MVSLHGNSDGGNEPIEGCFALPLMGESGKILNLLLLPAALMAQSRLIQFTEMLKWSPDVRFTEPERAELERLAVDEKTAAGLSKAQNIQRALSPEKWDQVRAEVEDGMLKSLRESPEEATSRLLL